MWKGYSKVLTGIWCLNWLNGAQSLLRMPGVHEVSRIWKRFIPAAKARLIWLLAVLWIFLVAPVSPLTSVFNGIRALRLGMRHDISYCPDRTGSDAGALSNKTRKAKPELELSSNSRRWWILTGLTLTRGFNHSVLNTLILYNNLDQSCRWCNQIRCKRMCPSLNSITTEYHLINDPSIYPGAFYCGMLMLYSTWPSQRKSDLNMPSSSNLSMRINQQPCLVITDLSSALLV